MEPHDPNVDGPLRLDLESLIAPEYHEATATFISRFISESQNEDSSWEAHNLYQDCIKKYPNFLSLKLCEFYLRSECAPHIRTGSIYLLEDLLKIINRKQDCLSPSILNDLKSVLVSCLRLQETPEFDFNILLCIVSAISVHVFQSEDGKWDELRDYIAVTIDSDFRKVFRLFHKLPAVLNNEFLMVLAGKLSLAIVGKLNLSHGDFEDWVLAFKAGFTFGVHMAGSPRSDLSNNMLREMIRSAIEIVNEGLERFLKRALGDLVEVVDKEAEEYGKKQNDFVSELVLMIGEIQGIGEDSAIVAREIYRVIEERKAYKIEMT